MKVSSSSIDPPEEKDCTDIPTHSFQAGREGIEDKHCHYEIEQEKSQLKMQSQDISNSIVIVVQTNDEDEIIDNKRSHQVKKDHRNLLFLFIFSMGYSFFYAGAFFGWGPMQLLLEENGAFHSLCELKGSSLNTLNDVCEKQTVSLINVQMIAQLNLILSPIFGYVSDVYGADKLAHFLGIASITGWILVILAVWKHIDRLLYLAFFLQSAMTIASNTLIVQTAVLFPFEGKGLTTQLVTSVLNSAFDGGAITFLGLWAFKNYIFPNSFPFSLVTTLSCYLGFGLIVFAGNSYFWNIVVHQDGKMEELSSDTSDKEEHVERVAADECRQEWHHARESQDCSSVGSQFSQLSYSSQISYVLIAKRTVLKQLISPLQANLLFFGMIHIARNIFVLTTARDFLAFLGDDETGNRYLSIFSMLTPASIIGIPFVDYILRRYGHHGGLQLVNLLGFAHGVITVFSSNLNLQILGFVLFSFYRCFLFTVIFSFGPTFLGSDVIGRGAGWMVFVSGIFSFVNIALKNWAIRDLGGNFMGPNLLYLCAILPCIFAAWKMGEGIKNEEGAKEKAKIRESIFSSQTNEN